MSIGIAPESLIVITSGSTKHWSQNYAALPKAYPTEAHREAYSPCPKQAAWTVRCTPKRFLIMKKVWRGCLISIVIGLLLFCGSLVYFASRPSALDNLHRFAQMPSYSPSDLQAVRSALLQLVPIGTPESAVYQFLRQTGVALAVPAAVTLIPIVTPDPNTRFPVYIAELPSTAQTLIHCSPRDLTSGIWCAIGEDPNRLDFPCRGAFTVQFVLGRDNKLKDITVQDNSACL